MCSTTAMCVVEKKHLSQFSRHRYTYILSPFMIMTAFDVHLVHIFFNSINHAMNFIMKTKPNQLHGLVRL